MATQYVYRDNDQRARLAIAGLIACIGARIADAAFYGYLMVHLGDPDLGDLEGIESGIGIAWLLALLATAILFLRWFRRAYENAAATGMRPRFSLGWSVGAWFVPILNLVRPPRMAMDMWQHASSMTRQLGTAVEPWFGLFIAGNFVDNIAVKMLARAEDADEVQAALTVDIVGDAFAILAALFGIRLVRRLTAAQKQRSAQALADVFGEVPPAERGASKR